METSNSKSTKPRRKLSENVRIGGEEGCGPRRQRPLVFDDEGLNDPMKDHNRCDRKDCPSCVAIGCHCFPNCESYKASKSKSDHTPKKKQLHPLSERYHQLTQSDAEMHARKSADYGQKADPFANIRATSEWACPSCHEALPAWLGALVRLSDKVARLKAFTVNGKLTNESLVDSLTDLRVYAGIAQVLYEQEAGLLPQDIQKLLYDLEKEAPGNFDFSQLIEEQLEKLKEC